MLLASILILFSSSPLRAAEPSPSPSPSASTIPSSPSPSPSPSPSASPSALAAPIPQGWPTTVALATPSPRPTPRPEPSVSPSPSASPSPALVLTEAKTGEVEFDHAEDSTLFFRGGGKAGLRTIKTSLSDVTYVGKITSPEKRIPYFIFAAKPCRGCAEEREIVFIRPDSGFNTRFEYPGKVIDPRSGAAVLDSRAFFGKCLRGDVESYVVFQRERVERRRRVVSQQSVFIAEADEEHLDERLIERRLPRLTDALTYVKRKSCHEISGHDRHMARRPPDLNARRRDDADEGDDDEDTKENQTDQELGAPAAAGAATPATE